MKAASPIPIIGKIESVAFGGEGILRHEGLVVFVPFTAPGDVVEVEIASKKKNLAHGQLLQILQPSPSRTSPACPYFGVCGGCQLQHLNPAAQLAVKHKFITDTFERIGKFPFPDFTLSPASKNWHYRRHIRLKLKKEGNGFVAGYAGYDPGQFIPIDQCPIFLPSETSHFAALKSLLSALSNEGIEEGSVRLIKTEHEKLLLAFQFSPSLPKNHDIPAGDWKGIVMQSPDEKKQWGETACQIHLFDLIINFSPFGFLQNHPEQTEKLYQAVLDALPKPSGKILDLYCGIGVTTLLCAREGWQAIGVESYADTVAQAKENAKINGLSAEFFEGKSEIQGVSLLKNEHPDVVLCNPPRTGLDAKLIDALVEEKPPYILYISCMPSTLARDLQKLIHGGYQIEKVQAFDMFPQTTHVETLVILRL